MWQPLTRAWNGGRTGRIHNPRAVKVARTGRR